MTLHVVYDHQCPKCGAYYIPYDEDVPCPNCGIVEDKRFKYIPVALESILYNLKSYGSYVSPGWWIGSLGDHILFILFRIFERFTKEKKQTDFAIFVGKLLSQMEWGNQRYLEKHIHSIAMRIYEEATFLPPPKRHIEEKRMKKREAREIGKVEQETLVKARRKWELRRIAEERGMKTQVPKYTIEELKSMRKESFEKPKESIIKDSLKKPKKSMLNDSLEKRKKKRVFEKIFSSIGIKEGNWVTMMTQFILHSLYGLVIVVVFGVVLNKISLSAYIVYRRILLFILGLVRNFILIGIGNIFLFLIIPFILLLIFAVILWIGSRGYYLVKGIGRLLFQKKK